MLKRILVTASVLLPALFAIALSTRAAPTEIDITGSYSARGKSSTGVGYQADVFIFKKGNAFTVRWVMLKGGEYTGVGLRQGDTLAVAYEAAEGNPGLALYRIVSKSTLAGRWTAQEADGRVGTETLTRD